MNCRMRPSSPGKAFGKDDSTLLFLTAVQLANWQSPIDNHQFFHGVLAQLVERLNGIEEVRGSNPLGSTLTVNVNAKSKRQTSRVEGKASSAR